MLYCAESRYASHELQLSVETLYGDVRREKRGGEGRGEGMEGRERIEVRSGSISEMRCAQWEALRAWQVGNGQQHRHRAEQRERHDGHLISACV
jgi:hypothetical protein